ncbi:MAG: hypothetical protein U1C04_18745 [Hydrogenophaga sp.]|uniref:hypothetical protein n=1 Tax=Hydrogenophaga sp. TaxID=1904254 RepID=UPI002AB7F88C|nr:hypothetical protein [Hydrogenophaga sp.]MDZ4282789.1 hypothetical protein [Hydrogenophaga sp.]
MTSSSPAPAAQPELDEALLQRAWRMLRPPCWPPSFVETMADPLRSQMVHMFARQLLRSAAAPATRDAWPAPAMPAAPRQTERRRPLPQMATGAVDRKRAAAGDRDDD